MNKKEIEDIEIHLLLEAISRRYGYDFRNYAQASMKRRIKHAVAHLECEGITELTGRLLYDESFFQDLVQKFSIPVTEMFRDPEVYRGLRKEVAPYLATYPFLKVWHAGCATGEEAYSIAILLKEEGLYNRTTIYATDFNEAALNTAKKGIYQIDRFKEYNTSYFESSGTRSLSEYYQAEYDSVIMSQTLKNNLTFARHNLVTDESFGEMHLILCRNVLIYFNQELQDRVLNLLSKSLIRGGFLCLGAKETLLGSSVQDQFSGFNKKLNIYRKKIE